MPSLFRPPVWRHWERPNFTMHPTQPFSDKQNCPQAKIIVPKPVARWLTKLSVWVLADFSDMDRTTKLYPQMDVSLVSACKCPGLQLVNSDWTTLCVTKVRPPSDPLPAESMCCAHLWDWPPQVMLPDELFGTLALFQNQLSKGIDCSYGFGRR